MAQALKDFHTQILALVALVVLVAGFVLAPADRLEHVGNALVAFGSTGYGASIYSALGALVLAIIKAAFDRVPKSLTSTTPVTTTVPVKVPASKESGSSPPSAIFLAASVGCAVVLAAGYLHGCGSAITDEQRAAYATLTAQCDAREDAVLADHSMTAAQHREAVDAIRAECEPERAAILHPDGGL